jgi:hypothetical protein
MTGAFTLLHSPVFKTKLSLLYGMYFEPDIPAPNTAEDYLANVNYLPYIMYPYEVVNQCQKSI